MGKRGPKPKDTTVKGERVGLYIMPPTRERLNWFAERLGGVSQDIALAAALDSAGVPRDVQRGAQVQA